MPHRRAEAEASVIDCSDAVLASCTVEADQIAPLYGGEPGRIRIVPPGVDHAFFGPGHRPQARRALGLPLDGRLLLFVGRIQPLKGADAAIETLAELLASGGEPYRLVVVGGPSGPHGEKALQGLHDVADARGVREHVHFVEPQPHELLSSYYRAADVCLVPSRSESFGLVALEAAACGTPVVASAVGGLTTLVEHGHTGFLVDDPDPRAFAAAVRMVFDEPLAAERFSTASVLRARHYTWRAAAAALVELRRARLRPPRRVRLSAPGPERETALSVPIVDLPADDEMAAAVARIDAWAERELAAGGFLVAAERQEVTDRTASYRWYLRFAGEEKDFVTVWLTLRQRTLHHEAQFMPAPETIHADVYTYLLRRNADLFGMWFALGPRTRSTSWAWCRRASSTTTSWTASPARRCLHRRALPDGDDDCPPLDVPPPPAASCTRRGSPRSRADLLNV